MNLFLRKISAFALLVLGICSVNFLVNFFSLKKVPKINSEILLAGDSRVMTAINPALIQSSANIAQNSESYVVTYFKLKHLLKDNPTIKTIVIGFSYPSFSGYMDSLYYDDQATADIFSRIYPIITLKDLKPLKVDELKFYSVFLKNTLLYPKLKHTPYLGEFVELKYGLNKADLDGVIKRHYFYRSGRPAEISIINKQYLDSIINLTHSKNIELVLVNIPLQSRYLERVPEKFIQFYIQEKSELEKRGIKTLDYLDLVLDDKFFKDYNHLDLDGANYFTQILKKDLGL